MVSLEEIVFLSTELPVAENFERLSSSPQTRYPLVGDEPADFLGIVYVLAVLDHVDDLHAGETTLEELAAPAMTVSVDTTVSDAIDQFQAERQELALVLSDGEVVGLLTARDAFEAVMGEIEDPLDAAATT